MDRLRQTIDKTETNEIVLCLGCGNESSNNKKPTQWRHTYERVQLPA